MAKVIKRRSDGNSWSVLTGIVTSPKVTASVLIFLCFVYSGSSLKCYHCLERPKSTEKHLSCAFFDRSEKFHKECTHSSFCMKRTSLYQLHNGTFITIYVHKCADQSHKTMVQDVKGDWDWAHLLRLDLYSEGCYPHRHAPSLLTTETNHCFCTQDLCNGSSLSQKPSTFLMSLITLSLLFVVPLNIFVIR